MIKKNLFTNKYWFICTLFLSVTLHAEALQLNGRLEWVHKIDMRVLYDGVVSKVNVKVGQLVKKGDVLLQLDSREAKAKLIKSKALVASTTADFTIADDELKRSIELYDRGLIAEEELKNSKAKHIETSAKKDSALASQTLAKIALERTTLRAPTNGIVVTQNIWKGSVIYKTYQKEPLISIAPNDKMLARILVNSATINRYKLGQKARVNSHGKIYHGKIYNLGLEAVRIETTGAVYELDILFAHNPQQILRPADVVKVSIP
jgi:multidrug efflux system membrane fusion protein